MRRKQIPHDVFFGDDETEPAPQAQDLTASPTVSQTAPPTASEAGAETGAETALQPPAEAKPEKVQVCVYLAKDTARMLDLMQVNLQYDHGVKVTKSDLVNYAVKEIAGGLEDIAEAAARGELEVE